MSREVTLGVLSPFLGGWYYGGIMAGIAQSGPQVNANVIAIQTFDAGTEQIEITEPPILRYPTAWDHVSGFIVILEATNSAYLRAIQEAGKPVVAISHEFADVECPVILPDNVSGVREIVAHLIGHGHRKIAFAGFLGADDVQERLQTYRETLLAHGIEPDPGLVFECGDNHQPGGELAGHRMIAAGVPSTAVVVGTDANAVGVMSVLTAAGYRFPQDQAIVGFDDQRVAAYASPRLTTVRQPVEMLGRLAVTEMMKLIRGESIENWRHYVPTAVVLRESCGCSRRAWPEADKRPDAPSYGELADRLRAVVSPVVSELASDQVDRDLDVVASAVAGDAVKPPAQEDICSSLDQLVRFSGRPEILMDMVNTVWEYGRSAGSVSEAVTGTNAEALTPRLSAVESVMLAMMQTHGRAQFDDGVHLQETLSRHYEVSTHLLRSHREDPRYLGWLTRTRARAGCLGLWAADRQPGELDPVLDIVGVFSREEKDAFVAPPATPVSSFPPAPLISLASEHPEGAVFVVPVKVDTSDWGLLAVVDIAEPEVATGREPINHWAALLTAALDYEQVLRDLRHRKEQLRIAALYDELTGLPNRALFLDRLRHAIARSQRRPDHQFAVLFLDLDGFKVVNDSLGHAAGDRLLVQVAKRITDNLRESDTAARFGGDEFIILLDGIEDRHKAVEVAERLQATLTQPFRLQDQDVVVTASMGITISSSLYADAEDLLRDADIAMYTAKSHMKGSHAVFDIAMRTRAVKRLQIETELRQAIERHEIEVHYQPIVHLPTGQIYAFEALSRWRHPVHGLIAPNDFLPIAEETGLINPLGRQVIAESCRRIAAWRKATGRDDLRVSVNISHRQLWTGTLLEDITESLRESQVDGRCLALELTESVVMRNVSQARTVLEDLHELGCSAYIDDFGTGYSSLEALHKLPIDALKIDRSFVSRLGIDDKSSELVHSIVLMGQKLGLMLIAEGVETEDQRDRLLRFGCAYGQGFLLSRPVPAKEAEALLHIA